MGKSDYFAPGKWNVICDQCGFKFKNDQLRKDWRGLMLCHGGGTTGCWEPRHPQDFVRGQADRQMPEWTRPEGDDVFIDTPVSRDDL